MRHSTFWLADRKARRSRQGRVTRPFAWRVRGRGEGANHGCRARVGAWPAGGGDLVCLRVGEPAARRDDSREWRSCIAFSAARAEAVLARDAGAGAAASGRQRGERGGARAHPEGACGAGRAGAYLHGLHLQ